MGGYSRNRKKWPFTKERKKRREIELFIKKYLHGTCVDRRLFAYSLSPADLTFLVVNALKVGMEFGWYSKVSEVERVSERSFPGALLPKQKGAKRGRR